MRKIITPRNDVNSTSVVLRDWLVADRASVLAGQRIANVETAKAVYEIDAPCAGILMHSRKVGEEVAYEDFIGVVLEAGETPEHVAAKLTAMDSDIAKGSKAYKATKKAEQLAHKLGVDLSRIKKEGIISEANVQAFADHNHAQADLSAVFLGPDQYPAGVTRVVVIGAGNSLAQIVDIFASAQKNRVVGAVDDNALLKGKTAFGVPVVGKIQDLGKLFKDKVFDAAIVGIQADTKLRSECFELCRSQNIPMVNAIDPSVRINSFSALGVGNVLCSFVHVGAYTSIGDNNFISAHCSIDHHNIWGSGITLGPGCHFSGRVRVGNRVKFGTGIAVQNKIDIGENCIISSGAIITNSIPANSILKTTLNTVIVPRT